MKKCKYCQGELEENTTVCPSCGRDNGEEELPAAAEEETPAAAEEETPAATEEEAPAGEEAAGEEGSGEEAAPAAEETAQEKTAQEEPTEPIREGLKATPGKIALAAAALLALLAVVIALVVFGMKKTARPPESGTEATGETSAEETAETVPATVPEDGNPDDVTCKGTYTVTDEEALANKDTVVAVMDGKELTNGQLQVYYWMEVQGFLNSYGSYAAYFGLDYTKPLDTQISMESEDMTWQHYFLQCALNNWHQVQAMALEAENAGLEMSRENRETLEGLKTAMEENAASYGMTLEDLLRYNIGPGAGFDEFSRYEENYFSGIPYYDAETAKLVPTQEELEEYFAAHEDEYAQSGITKDALAVDVRHILVGVDGGTTDADGVTTYSDEEWASCQQEAQGILDAWLAGEMTEESFAALANQKSQDGGSNTNGGLYQGVYEGQMVQTFNDWCFDAGRKTGDYGLVKSPYGYHVMYFVGSQPRWESYARQDWVGEHTNQLLADTMESHPIEVFYDKISLGYIQLG